MANAFSKEERVAFEDICQGFEDALVLSNAVSKYSTSDVTMERAGDTIWRPQPYIAQSFDGADQTSNFVDSTQLSVPATLSHYKSSPWNLDAKQLRDEIQEGSLGKAAQQKLASDVNVALLTEAANRGTIVAARSTAVNAGTFDDVAECDALFNEQGIQMDERYLALSSRVYNGMAKDLAAASRTFTKGNKSSTAYERAYVGPVAGFDTYKMDYSRNLAGNTVTATINGANQYHTPVATTTGTNGGQHNVDNRTQTIAVTVSSGTLAAGDCFTIAGVNAVHHITKEDTGQLKTFRVITGGGTGNITISPPIVSNGGSTDAEAAYQNVTATPANGAAITILNTADAQVNPFWHKDALEILPGRLAVPEGAGVGLLRATTKQGLTITLQKFHDIKTNSALFRADCLFGVVCKAPEMAGILLMGQ